MGKQPHIEPRRHFALEPCVLAEQGSLDGQEAVLDAFGAFEDAVAGGGQLESVRRPIEQPGAEAFLEAFEPAQHRRVRQP